MKFDDEGWAWYTAQDVQDMVNEVVRQAQKLAWQAGYASGWSNASRRLTDEPNAPITPNPFEDNND